MAKLGVAFGFPFIEYELKAQGVFYEIECANQTGDVWGPEKTLCNDALKLYNTLFTVATVFSMAGAVCVGFILDKLGMFWTRMIYCSITTLDLDDNANAYALIVIFSIAKTIVYAAPNMFLFYMFPAEHFGPLYGLLTAPTLVTMWLMDPLFRLILGDSDSLADADFSPVSIGFAVICGLCLLQVVLPKIGLISAAKKISKEKKMETQRDNRIEN
ncbi:Oidioi.mRNA.OKI2018_I69.chr2.g4967.t1.cds [Oikopleura dioica]|uniref:Oidioi.mRNA.OKI2018_I69.chr2.g4967.t1.cds n=1 Tax=Oikopleura dioica TaxID=34765 RepID=A0ABN7SYK2_OIKDI|nr:Oidioi.mRNA.OKI2018_I69.chr2.g4967.t1.cds [Oikopleura dioica]